MIFIIQFWHSKWVGKCNFDIQNPTLYQSLNRLPIWNWQNCSMFPLAFVAGWLQGHWWGFISRNYVVWPTFLLMNVFIALKGSHFWFLFDIRTESENCILTFKILFWHSNWVGKCNFDIQNPILTFELSRKIVFWHSKSYFDIRTQ